MENKEVLEELKEAMGKANQEELKACTAPEDMYECLQKYGLKISYEEMKEALKACSNEELSDEVLEGVAGGVNWDGVLK